MIELRADAGYDTRQIFEYCKNLSAAHQDKEERQQQVAGTGGQDARPGRPGSAVR